MFSQLPEKDMQVHTVEMDVPAGQSSTAQALQHALVDAGDAVANPNQVFLIKHMIMFW